MTLDPVKKSYCSSCTQTITSTSRAVKEGIEERITNFGSGVFGSLFFSFVGAVQLIGKIFNTCTARLTELGRSNEGAYDEFFLEPGAGILPLLFSGIFSLIRPTAHDQLHDETVNAATGLPLTRADPLNTTEKTILLVDSLHTKVFVKIEAINTTLQAGGCFKKHVLARVLYIGYIAAAIICRLGEFVCGAIGIAASIVLILLNAVIWNKALSDLTDRVIRFSFSNLTLLALPNDIIYAVGRVLNPAKYPPPKKEI